MGNSKDRGDETEARIIHEFVSSGYSVALPFGDNDRYDLVVDDDGELHRVQCKTTWMNKEHTIRFNTHTQTTKNGEYREEPYQGQIDAFVVHYPVTGTVYWIDIDDATEQKMELRFSAAIDHPSINWAQEYEFTGTIP